MHVRTYIYIIYILMVLQGWVMCLVFVQRQPECSGLGGGGDGQSFDHETRTHPTHMTLWVGGVEEGGATRKETGAKNRPWRCIGRRDKVINNYNIRTLG